jgi:hypothetical protein
MTLDSWPPCQASGAAALGLDLQAGARDAGGVVLPHPQRVAGIGLVAVGHDDGRDADPGEVGHVVGRRARDLLQRVGDRVLVAMGAHPLAQDRLRGLAPLLGDAVEPVGLDEAVHAAAAESVRQEVPALQVRRGVRVERGRDDHAARDPLGMREGEAQQCVGAHRGARETARSMPKPSRTASRSSASSG